MTTTYQPVLSDLGAKIDAENAAEAESWQALQVQYADALATIAALQPAPPPPPEPQMLVGSSLYTGTGETLSEGFTRRVHDFGAEPELVRIFYPGLPTGAWPLYGSALAIVSFKPPNYDMAGFVAGKYDTQVLAYLNAVPLDGRAKRVVVWHESEDDIAAKRFTAAQYRDGDAKLRQLANQVNSAKPKANIRVGIILMAWTLDPRSGRTLADYDPTAELDFVGWDAYPGDTAGCDLPDLTATRKAFTACRDATKTIGGRNWFICETGTRNVLNESAADYDTRQARWISGAFPIARELGCKGITYFDSTVGGDFRLIGPKAQAALGAEIKK